MLAPACSHCRHLDFLAALERRAFRCAAFPDGIPEVIQIGVNRHTEPFPGDHGIQFEARDEAEEARLVQLLQAREQEVPAAA